MSRKTIGPNIRKFLEDKNIEMSEEEIIELCEIVNMSFTKEHRKYITARAHAMTLVGELSVKNQVYKSRIKKSDRLIEYFRDKFDPENHDARELIGKQK